MLQPPCWRSSSLDACRPSTALKPRAARTLAVGGGLVARDLDRICVFNWRQPFRARSYSPTISTSRAGPPCGHPVHGFSAIVACGTLDAKAAQDVVLPYVAITLEPAFGGIDAYVPLIDVAVARAHRCDRIAAG